MLCSELMKTDVARVVDTDTVQKAARLMRERNVGFLPVVDGSGKVTGTVTDRDITTRLVAEDLPSSTHVARVMTNEIVSCRPDEDIRQAQQRMGQAQKSRILVTDGAEHLLGVISLSDIAQAESGDRAAQTMREITKREAA